METTHRIFIAEDHTIVREGLRSLLSSHQEFEVVGEAEDGRQTIKGVGQCTPDLLLIDLSMPRMNGIALSKQILEKRVDVPILLCTGFSEGITQEFLHDAGIREMVMKPLIASELADMVKRSIN